jgi:hypothetical protein
VADQNRSLAVLDSKTFEQEDSIVDHLVEPVCAAGGVVEAGGLAVSASVGRDDAVVVTPAAHRVRPAQA